MRYDEFLAKVEERYSTLFPHDIYANIQRFQFVVEEGGATLSPLKDGQLDFLPQRLEDLSLSVHAHKQLCARIDVPYAFLGRCPQNLQYLLMNYFIQHGGYDKEVMLRTIHQSQLRAIMSQRYTPFEYSSSRWRRIHRYDEQTSQRHLYRKGMGWRSFIGSRDKFNLSSIESFSRMAA